MDRLIEVGYLAIMTDVTGGATVMSTWQEQCRLLVTMHVKKSSSISKSQQASVCARHLFITAPGCAARPIGTPTPYTQQYMYTFGNVVHCARSNSGTIHVKRLVHGYQLLHSASDRHTLNSQQPMQLFSGTHWETAADLLTPEDVGHQQD